MKRSFSFFVTLLILAFLALTLNACGLPEEVKYEVSFTDYDGTVIEVQIVKSCGLAVAPTLSEREGYTFIGWDKSFENVTSDLTVTAQYSIKMFNVKFVDDNGTELKSQTVEYGSSATAPTNPEREGYSFTGWDKSFENVTSDLTVTAQYEKNVVVWDGSVAESFADGSGTEVDPYIISNGSELAYLAQITNDPNYDTSGKCFKLIDNVNLGGREWKPMGVYYYMSGSNSNNCTFRGNFNGNGYVVSDFLITTSETYERYFGLFGYVLDGNVSCLGVVNFTVNLQDRTNYTSAGGIAGYVYSNNTISNCYSTGNVSVSTSGIATNRAFAGGIGGYVGSNNTIINCYSTGNISASSKKSVAFAGGIAGDFNNSAITNCFATGNVSASTEATSTSYKACAGGLIGNLSSSSGTVTNCYRYDGQSVTATATSVSSVCEEGSVATLSNLLSESLLTETMKFGKYVSETDREVNTNNVWKFEANKYPALWNF